MQSEPVSPDPESLKAGPLGCASPSAIVDCAQRFIAQNIALKLTAKQVAEAVGVSSVDLAASYRYVLNTDLKKAISELRIHAFKDLIERFPWRELSELATEVGLELNQVVNDLFEKEFWQSPSEWRQACLSRGYGVHRHR